MATIVANGNRSVTSPAYANTDDGQFEHAVTSSRLSSMGRRASMNNRTGFTKERAMVFGPSTVYDAKGEPWESKHWLQKGEHPVENPDKSSKIRWVTKEHAARIEARMRTEGKKSFNNAYNNTSNAVSGGINKVTGAVGNEIGSMKSAGEAARAQYQRDNLTTSTPKGAPMLTRTYDKNLKNRVGETAAYVRGAVGSSSAAKAIGREAENIRSGSDAARQAYRDSHKESLAPGVTKYTGNRVGEALAGVAGGIGASAVGRAGKAAFNGLMDKIKSSREAFEAAIDKYVTGKSAGANRKELLEAGSRLIGQIRGAMGMLGDEGGRQTIGRNIGKGLNTALGTAAGIAGGIAKSKAGSAAIGAGKAVFSKVSSGVGSALDAIKGFFKKRSTTSSRAYSRSREASV